MQESYPLRLLYKKILGDLVTPVLAFLRLREFFPGTLLLESADYRGSENSFSYICCNPLASFAVENNEITERYPNGTLITKPISKREDVLNSLKRFRSALVFDANVAERAVRSGIFGYTSYQAIKYFEDIKLVQPVDEAVAIPDLLYGAFQFVLAFDHFRNELHLMQWEPEGVPKTDQWNQLRVKTIADLERVILEHKVTVRPFQLVGEERSNFDDADYMATITKCKEHIQRGDIFQIVPSRRFSQGFTGDEFNVYRALRSINPSPYLFFFDYGRFRIFGSSPEAQLVVTNKRASLFPIAGTLRRQGDEATDLELIRKLMEDPKENAEHVMLVDLARNDLSKHCNNVHVARFREAQVYSHVIHMVSRVEGTLAPGKDMLEVFADTFPAGTLSGAPKYRAMELIDKFERGARTFYGGAIGFFGANNDCNHAIIIRSFLSKANTLHSQAGGGVVADSVESMEAQEAYNKLMALKRATISAQELSSL